MEKIAELFDGFLFDLLYLIPAVVISLTIHEFSHAWVAVKLGDPTPRYDKRLSLNPLNHIDIIGFIVMLLVHFGWAKPVRVNPMYFENPRKGMMYTALAGPISNLVLCIVASLLYFLSVVFSFPTYLVLLFYYLTFMNISLAVFNLIPIAPLDGSRIVSYFFPRYATFMAQNGNIIQIVFIALLILPGYVPMIPDVFGGIISGVQLFISSVLFNLWKMIFWFLI